MRKQASCDLSIFKYGRLPYSFCSHARERHVLPPDNVHNFSQLMANVIYEIAIACNGGNGSGQGAPVCRRHSCVQGYMCAISMGKVGN